MTNKAIAAKWKKISACIADEMVANESFAQRMAAAMGEEATAPAKQAEKATGRAKGRASAKINPFALLEQGPTALTAALASLDIEELKDVIAANGMDAKKLAMKWKKRERLEQHILQETARKSSHGDAFWNASAQSGEER
ncbi:MAG: hypothetical protein LBD02_02260 [Christensenellaceae bacterium]|jgi:hypothetical protein|nr:hypothetical protein [Christensenellaceae bacterium]